MRRKMIGNALIVAAVFTVLTVIFSIYFYNNADLAARLITDFQSGLSDLETDDGGLSFFELFRHNLFAAAMCIAIGIIPFLFLPGLSMAANTVVMGALLGMGGETGIISPLKVIVFGMLPHGIFELPALFMSMAMGFMLCKSVSMRIIGKRKDGATVLVTLNFIAKTFFVVVAPLLLLASLVECYVTPMIIASTGL